MLPPHLAPRERKKSREKVKRQKTKESTNETKKSGLPKSKEPRSQEKTADKSSENAKAMQSIMRVITAAEEPPIGTKSKEKSKEKNSAGYKRSSNSTAQSETTALNTELFIEDIVRTREMSKKSMLNTINFLLFSIGLLVLGYLQQYKYDEMEEKMEELHYAPVYPSVTHYKMSILTDKSDISRNIKDVLIEIGSAHSYQREAAIYYTYCFKRHLSTKLPITYPFSLQTSILAWGFDANAKNNDVGPVIVHNQSSTEIDVMNPLDLGKSLSFSIFGNDNSSLFSTIPDLHFLMKAPRLYEMESKNVTGKKTVIQRHNKVGDAYEAGIHDKPEKYHFSTVDPRVNENPLWYSSTHKFGLLQITSSGPNTLGAIAEIAIHFALELLDRRFAEKFVPRRDVDYIIAQSIGCALKVVVQQRKYFKNLILDSDIILETLKDPRLTERCMTDSSTVKLHTNGVLTSNILFMGNRDGWPTVFHYSVSTNGFVNLEFNGKNSTGLLNVCQVVVIKEGNLWLTAAASGEFYLLEKVVASIVHKIVMNTDPLALLKTSSRKRYDIQTGRIVAEKYKRNKNVDKEILQFSVFNSTYNRFRSWVEKTGNTFVASGY